jgi:hypothetical protein
MSATFPSAGWFRRLTHRMAAQREKYRKLGAMDLTLVPRVIFPDGHSEFFSLAFEGHCCRTVEPLTGPEAIHGQHPVIVEGEYAAWKDMVENIRRNGHADLSHTLDYLTLPDCPLRLVPVDDGEGQVDVNRFYRYKQTLQEFFDESAALDTRFVANGG